MTTSRDRQKEETRQRVLEVARRHFEQHGFDEANLRAIAAEAKVSAATVLVHFVDKRELLHAALFDDLEATLERALRELPEGELGAQLQALTEAFFGYYLRRPKLSRTLLREALFADPPWAQRFAAQVGRVHARIAELYQRAAARGEVREDGDGALFAVAYFSFYYFALIAWVQGGHASPVKLVERLVAQHLEGLRPAAAGRKRR